MNKKIINELDKVLKINNHTNKEDVLWNSYLPSFLKINQIINQSIQDYFSKNNFSICTPSILVGVLGSCENFDTVYRIKKINQGQEFLSQTAQLQLERLMSFSFKKVACITRSFRNENIVNDGRHLKEFTLVEMEMSNCELSKLLNTIEDFVKYVAKNLYCNDNKEILKKVFDIDLVDKKKQFLNIDFPKINYKDAVILLQSNNINVKWGDDLTQIHEQKIVELKGGTPIFITHFPEHIKFFNMRINRNNNKVVNSADLILPISGEAVGAAEREYDYKILIKRFKNSEMYKKMLLAGIKDKDLGCYFKIVKKGQMPKHAGCGIGLERLLQSLLSTKELDIRLFSQSYILNRLLGIT